ncbi:DUF397 domain-containing protein [Streptomyces sp. NPDC051018]|uniref:DUF397 domain-containing protein n=1 Tax=Streptomyces sp. NPDC051018 TaxID=3365639 RepID=UPI0037BBCCE3
MDHDDDLWIKSSYSGGSGTECVEAARLPSGTAVRDSKAPLGPRLLFPGAVWAGFVSAISARELH